VAAFWPPFGVFLSCLGFRRSVLPSPVRPHRHSRHNMRDAKSMASNRILLDFWQIGAHAARTGGFEIIDQDGDIERRMDAHQKMDMIGFSAEFD